jgi:hypothetical protein
MYYKIRALKELGVEIILHCYQYGRNSSTELEQLCKQIYYYQRGSGIRYYLNPLPYIVVTRSSNILLNNLVNDPYPVLFEGIHTSCFINHPGLKNKVLILRTHNIEHEYYRGLARAEPSLVHKLFFYTESGRLKRYERNLPKNILIAAISSADTNYFSRLNHHTIHLPPFHPFGQITSLPGKGKYILVHGDLSVPSNIYSVQYLVKEIFGKIPFQLIVAGKNPARRLLRLTKQYSNIKLLANPDESVMVELVRQAQINLIHSFQPTGIKLKLITALFNGRHCIVNPEAVRNSGLDNLCHIGQNIEKIKDLLYQLMEVPFTEENIIKRETVLKKDYSNKVNAQTIYDLI